MTFQEFMRRKVVAVTIDGDDWEEFCSGLWDTAFEEGKQEGIEEGKGESSE